MAVGIVLFLSYNYTAIVKELNITLFLLSYMCMLWLRSQSEPSPEYAHVYPPIKSKHYTKPTETESEFVYVFPPVTYKYYVVPKGLPEEEQNEWFLEVTGWRDLSRLLKLALDPDKVYRNSTEKKGRKTFRRQKPRTFTTNLVQVRRRKRQEPDDMRWLRYFDGIQGIDIPDGF